MAFIALHPGVPLSSDKIAESMKTNPGCVRQLMSALRQHGLLASVKGHPLPSLAREPSAITLLDVYRAVDCVEEKALFHFHENPNMSCPVGRNIHNILDDKLLRAQEAMEWELQAVTLADLMADLERCL